MLWGDTLPSDAVHRELTHLALKDPLVMKFFGDMEEDTVEILLKYSADPDVRPDYADVYVKVCICGSQEAVIKYCRLAERLRNDLKAYRERRDRTSAIAVKLRAVGRGCSIVSLKEAIKGIMPSITMA